MAKDKISEEVQGFLTKMGLKVDRIKETEEKTPDLSAIDENNQNYLFEVKNILNDRLKCSYSKSEEELGFRSGVHSIDNTISGIIKNAYIQLKTYNKLNNSLNIIWLLLENNKEDFVWKNIRRTLYGTRFVSDSKLKDSINCFYADRSDFFRYSDSLDCLIISDHHSCELLLNSFSSKYEQVKKSFLYNKLFPHVFDPIYELNKNDCYLCLEPNENSKDEVSTLKRLKEKYGFENPRFSKIDHYEYIEKKTDIPKGCK